MLQSVPLRFVRNVATGAGQGAALAGVFLLVGVVRAAFALALGHSMAALTASDVRMLEAYVIGFVIAGAFVGALRPVLRGPVAICAALGAGGVIVMNTLAIADEGWAGMQRFDWIAMTLMGALLGCALAWGYLRGGKASH